jgi:hypothetical protein
VCFHGSRSLICGCLFMHRNSLNCGSAVYISFTLTGICIHRISLNCGSAIHISFTLTGICIHRISLNCGSAIHISFTLTGICIQWSSFRTRTFARSTSGAHSKSASTNSKTLERLTTIDTGRSRWSVTPLYALPFTLHCTDLTAVQCAALHCTFHFTPRHVTSHFIFLFRATHFTLH